MREVGGTDGVAIAHGATERWEISVRGQSFAQNAANAAKEVYRFQASGPDLSGVLLDDMPGIFKAQDRRRMRKRGHALIIRGTVRKI